MRSGAQWLANHYAANDYYSKHEQVTGRWVGKGAAHLGIEGRGICGSDPAFLAVFSDRTPGGDKLKQRRSEIIGYDFECSAQKSVSVMALVCGDARLIEAHRAALAESFSELEKLSAKQSGQGPAKRRDRTGNLCAARFDHDSSRALDPQLHTHFAIANFTVGPDGKRCALETHDMVQAIRYFGKVYQSALRREVERLGYKTEDRVNVRGQLEGFEIGGVPTQVLEMYSRRRADIERAIAEFKKRRGRDPTAAEIHVIAKETRAPALLEATSAQVRKQQRSRLSRQLMLELDKIKEEALIRSKTIAHENSLVLAREVVQYAREHLSERQATFPRHQLLAECLNRGMGRVGLEQLKLAIEADAEFVRLDDRHDEMAAYSCRDNVRRETESVRFVNVTADRRPPINRDFAAFLDGELRNGEWLRRDSETGLEVDLTEQKAAVEAMLRSTDQVFAVRGVAGAGKTTAMREYDVGVRRAERYHIVLAPTAKAVEILRSELRDTGSTVMTVQRFLALRDLPTHDRPPLKNAVITVDEWGLLSNRMGHELLAIARENHADVRFVGDTKQHGSVEAGDFGRMLERHSNLRWVMLSQVRRQRDPEYNKAVRELAAGDAVGGLALLDAKGWIHEHGSDYVHAAVDCFLERTKQCSGVANANGSSVIAVAPSHAEIGAFTAELRERLQEIGALLGESFYKQAFLPYDTTTAQRRSITCYRPGDAVVISGPKSSIPGLISEEVYNVVRAEGGRSVLLAAPDGRELSLDVRKYGGKLEIGNLGTIELRKGDRILFRANAQGITNGQIATVASVTPDGCIVIADGRAVPSTFLRLTYGYATTSHTAQGITTEYSVAFGRRYDRKSLYVSHSRAKERTDTFVPEKEHLFATATRLTGDRHGALDLIYAGRDKTSGPKGIGQATKRRGPKPIERSKSVPSVKASRRPISPNLFRVRKPTPTHQWTR